MNAKRTILGLCTALACGALTSATWAQTATVPPPAPVETTPLPTPGAPAAPMAPAAPAPVVPPPGAPPAAIMQAPPPGAPAPVRTALPTMVPDPGDASDVDEVVLPEKPVLVLTGSSTWEDGLKNLRAAFARLEAELAKDGVAPAGRPLAVFIQTTDDNFRFEAMVPVAATPNPAPAVGADMRWGVTPSGKAYRFVHKAPYDDIDSTYETITAYLDAKDVVAKDAFIEEYTDDITDPGDPNLEMNIFVQPK